MASEKITALIEEVKTLTVLELAELVHALEEGSAGLDDSLKLFEEGIGLVRYCTEKLDEAEQRVKILMENAEGLHEEDFPKEG